MASQCLSASSTVMVTVRPSFSLSTSSSSSSSNNFSQISFKSFLPPPSLSFRPLRCSVKPRARIFCMASNEKNAEPLWTSFGKAIENLGKKPSVEDLLKQQIEKQEYYDEGGGGGNRRGSGGGGGGGGFGESEEEGFSGVLDETIQVILATLGFFFLYFYIINGAEMARLAKDYIKYTLGGRKSVRLTRALYQWERFCKQLTEKKEVDRFWLEKAIINTPTWWDSPEKYRRILNSYMQLKSSSYANEETKDEYY